MKVPDINLLLYAINSQAPNHRKAKLWLECSFSEPETIGFSWIVLLGVLRIGTNSRIFANPYPINDLLDLIDEWLNRPNVSIIEPTHVHFAVLRKLITPLNMTGNITSDAHLAAICIEHDATLYSADIDFAKFSGLRWVNPLDQP